MLQDSLGRTVRALRLEVTRFDPCRRIFAPPAEAPAPDRLLTPAEMESLCRHLVVRHGLRKVRLVGGEPTVRDDLREIVSRLARIEGLEDLAMTTSGLTLFRDAPALKQAGLRRVNIWLDSLEPEKYQRLTGIDGLGDVLRGIDAAVAAGLRPVKLNTVVIRGENDFELSEMLLFAAWKRLEIRFIELMPGAIAPERWRRLFVSEAEIRQRLADVVTGWVAPPQQPGSARVYSAGMTYGRHVRVGFITAMSCPFCESCDRVHISCEGGFSACLADRPAADLLPALRPAADPEKLDRLMLAAMARRSRFHPGLAQTPSGQP